MKPSLQFESEPSYRAGYHAAPSPGTGFGDGGEQIPTVQPPDDPQSELVVDFLLNRGFELHVAEQVAASFDDLLDAVGGRSTVPESAAIGKLLAGFMNGARGDAREVGERVILLASHFNFSFAPKSNRELGDWLDCSHVTAAKRLAELSALFPVNISDS